jgi:hypothetical protein
VQQQQLRKWKRSIKILSVFIISNAFPFVSNSQKAESQAGQRLATIQRMFTSRMADKPLYGHQFVKLNLKPIKVNASQQKHPLWLRKKNIQISVKRKYLEKVWRLIFTIWKFIGFFPNFVVFWTQKQDENIPKLEEDERWRAHGGGWEENMARSFFLGKR